MVKTTIITNYIVLKLKYGLKVSKKCLEFFAVVNIIMEHHKYEARIIFVWNINHCDRLIQRYC